MGQRVRRGGLYETIEAGENIVTLKAVSSGAMGQRVRRGGLYETIEAGRKHCNPKGCFIGGGNGSAGEAWRTL